MSKYEAVIGLEIHAELKTNSKMFCGCKNEPFFAKPNENICPICIGMPGVLPVLNKKAIGMTIKTGLTLNCEIAKFTKWDRKNYFYPDLPKGYQISQYDLPLCHRGYLAVEGRKIGITRIHLEEDTGTSKHPEGRADVDYSLLDYNRSGVPLMELVTEPDITNGWEAREFCKKYQEILRGLGASNADMEKGQMRCEVNISLKKIGEKSLGTKVEIKNLNSFKSVEKSIKYETDRQEGLLLFGEKIIQETRGWNDQKGETYSQRVKETSADYRYFPEPDLPPVKITESEIEKIKKELPEMLEDKIERYVEEYKLSEHDAKTISSDPEIAGQFEERLRYTKYPRDLGTWTVNEPDILDMDPKSAGELVDLVHNNKISKTQAKGIFPDIKKGKSPRQIIKDQGLEQISDTAQLEIIIEKIINANSNAVAKIKSGQMGVMGFLVGQVMRETKGQANPKLVNEILRKKIK